MNVRRYGKPPNAEWFGDVFSQTHQEKDKEIKVSGFEFCIRCICVNCLA